MSNGCSSPDASGGEKDEAGDVDVQLVLEMSGIFSGLVPDIFLNIMSRVPLKSLSQCRWVCKSWYRLVKSPSFAKIQYEWAIKNSAPWAFYWNSLNHKYLVDDQVFYNLETSATAHTLALEFPRYFAGCVNGLLCVASHPMCYYPSSICICNPVTGEHIAVPKSPKYKTPAIAAFGFDPTTNEYKVIRLINYYKDNDRKYLSLEGEVYTLGSSEWRKIDVPLIRDEQRCGVLLDGILHWMSYVSKESQIINTFTVGLEKFDVIQLPSGMVPTRKRLVVVEGHLCFIHMKSHSYEIWEMQNYGVQSSWVKKYSFKAHVGACFMYGSHDLIKLRNGEFLLQVADYEKEGLGYLNPVKDTVRPIRITRPREPDFDDYLRSVVQVGSLFSPKDAGKSRRVMKVDQSAGCSISS